MVPAENELLTLLENSSLEIQHDAESDLIQSLINEILRVKDLIKRSQVMLNELDEPEPTVLTELLSEAYHALINYDIVLMQKYYDLLLNCD